MKRSDYTNEEWEFLQKMRRASGDPLLNPTREEALSHARSMGWQDTIRGVTQMFAQGMGWEEKLEELQEGDSKLHEILQNEEYGNLALANFIGSAAIFDPVNLVPGIGIYKKAKTIKQALTYGSVAGGTFGFLGYESQVAPGILSEHQSRVENAAIGATAGAVLGGVVGGGTHLFHRMRGKPSPYDPIKVETPDTKVEAPDRVPERQGVGEQLDLPLKDVQETLSENSWVKVSNIDRSRTKEIIDTDTGIKTETFFDSNGNRVIQEETAFEKIDPTWTPFKGENARSIYRIQRIIPADGNLDLAEWKVIKIKQNLDENNNVLKEQSLAEIPAPRIKDKVFVNEYDAMEHIQSLILRRQSQIDGPRLPRFSDAAEDARKSSQRASDVGEDPEQASINTVLNRTQDELEKADQNQVSIKTPIHNFYEKYSRTALKNAVFNSWGTSLSGVGGALYGYNASDDINASVTERLASGFLWGLALGTGTNIAGRIKLNSNETLGQFISKGIIDDYGLPSRYKNELRRDLGFDRNKILDEFEAIMIKMSKGLTPDQNRMLYGFMNGDFPSIDRLEAKFGREVTSKMKALSNEAHNQIEKYGNELVKFGMLNAKTFNANLRQYLHRTYKRHMEGTEDQKAFRGELKRLSLTGHNLRNRGLSETIPFSSFETGKVYKKYLRVEAKDQPRKTWKEDGFEIVTDNRTAKQKKDGTGKVEVHRDFTLEERRAIGEIEDAAFATVETGRLFSHDIPMARFFRKLSIESDENGKRFALDQDEWGLLTKAEKATYIIVPETKAVGTKIYSYGELGARKLKDAEGNDIIGIGGKPRTAPMYLQRPIFNDITHMIKARRFENEQIQSIVNGLEGVQTTWKKLKTAWIPAVHVNNTISNVLLLDLADTSIKYLPRAIKELLVGADKKSKLYKLARTYGVFDVDLVTKEFNKERADAYARAAQKLTGQDLPAKSTFMGYNIPAWTQKIGEYMMPLKKLTVDAAERSYQLEDQFFRMAVFMDRMDKFGGLAKATPKQINEAALEARKWFIDYNINAPVIDWLRRTTTPFISYTYRVIPLLAEAAIMRPQKFAKWAVAGYLLNKVGQKMAGGDEESERLTMREELTRKLFDVPFMPPTLIKMPFRSASGDSQYLDISRWVPGGDIYEQREQGVPGIPTPFQPSFGIYGDLLGTFVYRKDPFTGQDVDGLGIDDFALIKDFIRKETPNIPVIPGSYAYNRMRQAYRLRKQYETGEVEGIEGEVLFGTYEGSPYTEKYSPFEAWLYGFGVKLRPQDIQKNKELKTFEYEQQRSLIIRMYSEAETSFTRGRIGPEEKQDIYDKADLLLLQLEGEWQAYRSLLSKHERETLIRESEEEREREGRVTGGLIKGEDVPYTKEDPATRINPITGEPYVEEGLLEALQRRQEDRTLMNRGGLLSTLQKRRQGYKEGDEVKGGDPESEEIRMLQEQIDEMYQGRNPLTETAAQARAMGYEDLPDLLKARLASGQMVNEEFGIEVGNYMGPIGASSIDASRYKTLFTTPKNLRGTYYRSGISQEDRRAREAASGIEKVFQESGMEGGDPDMVYALSAINANPRLQAHEFRHRAGYGERDNQLLDAWGARTPKEWRDSVKRWKNYYRLYGGTPTSYQSDSEAEEALLEQLQNKREMILALEADWMEGSEKPRPTMALEFNTSSRRRHHYAKLATLDESGKAKYRQDFGLGQDFDVPTEEQNEARSRNLENLSNSADIRSALRMASYEDLLSDKPLSEMNDEEFKKWKDTAERILKKFIRDQNLNVTK